MIEIQIYPPIKEEYRSKLFVKGPISYLWLKEVSLLQGKVIHVAIVLCFLKGVTKSNTFKLQPKRFKEFGVSKTSYLSALKKLEQAKLISITKKPGNTHIVTILEERSVTNE